ncbi:nuclear transport factor 2 family protein [Polaribacter vadi]|uniref:nuclear transport factor 2 family protein n=1 Tax=Polaribacter vadi TaxID=1774273 RepID=UPI0030ED4705|tara:strand:+ start:22278 stop:22799 length:522 start_codon:yes stop_codon:yes gene_type:complete
MIQKGISFVALFFILVGCNSVKEISFLETKEIKNNVNTVLNDWHLAASDANFETYFSKMDSISVFIGTDATENWNKEEFKAYSKPYFDKGKAWSFTTLERNIYVNNSGNFVWFDELLNTQMGTCRGSGVLEKKGNSWKIKHYVLSITIPNEDVNAVIKAKKKNDDLFLKKFKN